jgi:hypothetical protein
MILRMSDYPRTLLEFQKLFPDEAACTSESLLRREIKNRQRPEITAKKRTSGVVTEIYVRPKIVW